MERNPVLGIPSILVITLCIAFTGHGCGEDEEGYTGPAVPLGVSAIFSVQPDDNVLIVVSLVDSLTPIHMVNDAEVTINGYSLPRYQGGYLYTGPFDVDPGDDITLQIKRGLTIRATLTFPGKAEFTAPQSGDVFDASEAIQVAWTAPAIAPQRYTVWVSEDYTESPMGWNTTVTHPETSTEIPADELKTATSGITIRIQAENQTNTFVGETLGYSYFNVSNQSESPPFSTQ